MIRVGLLIDKEYVPKWVHDVIVQIKELDDIQIVVIVQKQSIKTETKRSYNYSNLIFDIHYYIDRYLHRKLDVWKHVNIPPLENAKHMLVDVNETEYRDEVVADSLSQLKQENLDLLLRFGFRILTGEILNIAKHGVWSFHHGDNSVNRGGPPGIWEVIEGKGSTGVTLQVLSESLDGGIVLATESFRTHKFSFLLNQSNIYSASSAILLDCLKKLVANKFEINQVVELPKIYGNRLYKVPRNTEMVKWYLDVVRKIWLKLAHYLKKDSKWRIAVGKNIVGSPNSNLFSYKILKSPRNKYWADPFVIERQGKNVVYFEEYDEISNKGSISCGYLNDSRNLDGVCRVISEDFHMSYPFLFDDGEELYMIPETAETASIRLYKCESFPYKWKFLGEVLNDLVAVDTTVHYDNGIYWLLTYEKNVHGSGRLRIFYSEKIFGGEWLEHDQSPFANSLVGRPAGSPFIYNGKRYRPIMNNTNGYGSSMIIKRIEVLNKEKFVENEVDSIEARWDNSIIGIHTFNFNNNYTVIDILKKS